MSTTNENINANEVATTTTNEATPATKAPKAAATKTKKPRKKADKTGVVAEVLAAEAQENKTETPAEKAPKISKFEKVSKEFCEQNNITENQLLKYLLKKSVNKKTNLNALADDLMHNTFFNKEKMLTEILG